MLCRINNFAFLFLLLCCSCQVFRKPLVRDDARLRFVGSYELPTGTEFRGTRVGGLSGIDYDPVTRRYLLICDDGSKLFPARYYTADIAIDETGIKELRLTGLDSLREPTGSLFVKGRVDPEAARYAGDGSFYWTAEGIREREGGGYLLRNPHVWRSGPHGNFIDSFSLPPNMHMQAAEQGPRNNSSFEGLAIDPAGQRVYVSVEEPLFEDGPRAGTGDSAAWLRILAFDIKKKSLARSYAYRVEPVAHPAVPAGAFQLNGITDLLWAGRDRLLVLERSFSTGVASNVIRVFLADLGGAEDVSATSSFRETPPVKPVKKKLLLNMDLLKFNIDNIEGMTLGPRLANGHQTILFVSDDNFSPTQKTQFLLFELD